MKLLLSCGLLLTPFLFNNCTICSCKKVPCPAFNNAIFTSWFPYSANQQVIFKSGSLTDTFYITNIENSVAYDAQQGCYGGDYGCTTSSYFRSVNLSQTSYNLLVQYISETPFESSSTSETIILRLFEKFNATARGINAQGLQDVSPPYSTENLSTVTISGYTFNNVQLIKKDTTGQIDYSGPYKVYIAKNEGMVAYENYPALQTWVRQ